MIHDEEVVYGGMLFDMFGHTFTESLCRMWYVLEQKDRNTRIAFCLLNTKVPEFFYEFMKLLGVDRERILIVDKVMGFRKIIIPEQSLLLFAGYHENVRKIYQEMAKNALLMNQNVKQRKKIYLSRAKHVKRGIEDSNNESYFEQFYQKRGYEVVYPEKLPLCEQIALMAQAEDVVCTGGTLSHMILFAREGIKLTILLRCNALYALAPQLIINQLKKLDVCIVDCSFNYFPTTHAGGVFLIGPTKDFVQYLKEEKIPFSEDEIKMDFEGTAYKYLMSWIHNYNCNEYPYKRIKTQDIFDIVNRMSTVLLDKPLNREQMATPAKSNVPEKEFKELRENYECIKENAGRGYLYRQAFEMLKAGIYELKEDIFSGIEDKKFQIPDSRMFLTYDVHFSHLGWINGNGEYILTGTAGSGRRIEAVRIDCYGEDTEIEVGVYVDKVGWKKGKSGQVVGTVGESKPIIGLFLKLDSEWENLYDIFYRVGNEEQKTKWCKNGEVTDTFHWEKLETLEIHLESKENKLDDEWKLLIEQIKKERELQQRCEEKICELTNQAEEFSRERDNYKQEVGNLKEHISQLEAEWKEKYKQLEQHSEEKEQELKIQEEKFNKDRENYTQEIETLNERIYKMEKSFSWKITRPFKSISGK